MSKTHEIIDSELASWVGKQSMFLVATAPLSPSGHINTSRKGGDSFRILGPREVAYQDYTGRGAETAAHLQENGRILVMSCGFNGSPRVLRARARATGIKSGDGRLSETAEHFPPHP